MSEGDDKEMGGGKRFEGRGERTERDQGKDSRWIGGKMMDGSPDKYEI